VQGGGEWKQVLLRQQGFAVRLNDGRVNKNGALIIGGINETWGDFEDEWKAVQPCYCIEKALNTEGSPALLVSINQSIPLAKITNSICFSRDGSTMFHADTPTNEIRMFSSPEGTPGGDVIIKTEHGPDGSVIDARDGLWNAEYEGGVVNRYELSSSSSYSNVAAPISDTATPPVLSFHTPVKQTTCPCIGGPAGDILFVTTASNFFVEERFTKEPLAGHVFMFKLPTSEYYIAENLFDDDQ